MPLLSFVFIVVIVVNVVIVVIVVVVIVVVSVDMFVQIYCLLGTSTFTHKYHYGVPWSDVSLNFLLGATYRVSGRKRCVMMTIMSRVRMQEQG